MGRIPRAMRVGVVATLVISTVFVVFTSSLQAQFRPPPRPPGPPPQPPRQPLPPQPPVRPVVVRQQQFNNPAPEDIQRDDDASGIDLIVGLLVCFIFGTVVLTLIGVGTYLVVASSRSKERPRLSRRRSRRED
jgi:hypothetical protein